MGAGSYGSSIGLVPPNALEVINGLIVGEIRTLSRNGSCRCSIQKCLSLGVHSKRIASECVAFRSGSMPSAEITHYKTYRD